MITIQPIRSNPSAGFFRVTDDNGHEWIIRPECGQSDPVSYGVSESGFVWFCTREGEILIYEVEAKTLVARLPFKIKPRSDYDRFSGVGYRALASSDGNHISVLRRNGIQSRDLAVVSVKKRCVVQVLEQLPGGGGFTAYPPVLDQEGRILLSSSIQSGTGRGHGLIRIQPETGKIEKSVCSGTLGWGWLNAPSPFGRYWLRFDHAHLPIKTTNTPRLGIFGRRPKVTEEFFGLGLEIWESFPLQYLRTVFPLWLTADELPDEGDLDPDRKFDPATGRMTGPPAKRRKLYRKMSEMLSRDQDITMHRLDSEPFSNAWPDEEYCRRNVSSNIRKLGSDIHVAGWQPDGKAFWITRKGFVACAGIDGTVSPRIMLERYGYHGTSSERVAKLPRDVTPAPNRCADLTFTDGVVTVSGHPSVESHNIRVIPRSDDQWRPRGPDPQRIQDEKAIKKAIAAGRKQRTYKLKLASLSESDCAAAIAELAAQIGPDLPQRVFNNTLVAVFVCDRKRLNEQKFFRHVQKNCPSATEPLRLLIGSYCTHADAKMKAYWKPEKGIGAFAHAAWCLASMDPNSSGILRRYGNLIDTYQEYFFMGKTVPLMVKNLGRTVEMLNVAEWVLFEKLGNCMTADQVWKNFKMSKTAEKLFSPREYAARLLRAAGGSSIQASHETKFGHLSLDRLFDSLEMEMSAWEEQLFDELIVLHNRDSEPSA